MASNAGDRFTAQGVKNAAPTEILQLMNVEDMTVISRSWKAQ